MALIGLSEPQASPRGWAPFALGFRPFFLLAGLAAVVLLAVWGWAYVGGHMLANYYGFSFGFLIYWAQSGSDSLAAIATGSENAPSG